MVVTWERAIEEANLESSRALASLDQDITARFSGLKSVVEGLGNQVSTLSDYANTVPITRVDFAQASGWPTQQGWGTKVSLSVPIPNYPCSVNVYAAAHAHVWSQKVPGAGASVDQFANGRSRITIAGLGSSPEIFGALTGPDGDERWALGITYSATYRANGGSLSVNYDVLNGNTYNASGTDAGLVVIATFTRAI